MTVGEIRERRPVFERHRGTVEAEQNLPDIIEELLAAGNLGTQEENTLSLETQEEDVLVVSADDPATLENARLPIELLGRRLSDLETAEMERIIEAVVPALMRNGRRQHSSIGHDAMPRHARISFGNTKCSMPIKYMSSIRLEGKESLGVGGALALGQENIRCPAKRTTTLYPAFQFDAQGRPRQMISKVLAALGTEVGGWQTALWFVTPNGWLDEEKPVDMLEREPLAVLDAAADVAEPVAH